MTDMHRHRLKVDEIDTAYAEFGSADSILPPVVALHGWGASADLIAPLGEKLAKAGFRILAPDLPGFGQTPPPPRVWTVYDYAEHVMTWMNELALDRVHLFGHSFGGRLSLILGANYSERVASIALSNSAGVPPRKDPVVEARTVLYKRLRDGLQAVGLTAISDRLRRWYIGRYASSDYKDAGALRDSFVKIVNEDLLPCAKRINAPTLLLWGARDTETPLWQGQKLQEVIPNAGMVIYDDAGHYSYLDRLNDVVVTLDYFYKHPTGK